MGFTKLHDRWGELNDLFHEAMSLTPTEAATLCEKIAQDDPELAEFLRDLISSATEGDNELRESIEQVARDVASSDSLIGERVGAYQVEELIGRGGMGEVYLASRADGEFEKKVAIKVVRKRLAAADYLPVSRNERQALATLGHPGVPALVDSGQLDDGRSYFICDYVEGKPLQQYCTERGLPLRDRLDLFCEVARALIHAHNRLVLHLDIKPDNILVKKDGRPSLLDFGVARMLNDSDDRHLAFSPGYASPEQIRNENVDVTSDVYSMGALLYFLLTGKAPFESPRYAQSNTIIEVRSSEASEHRRRASLAELDADLRAIVMRAMAETPTDRYDSVSALMQDVQHYLEHRPVVARDGGPAYRARKFLRRNAVAVSLVAMVFAGVVGAGLREAGLRRVAAQEAETATQVSDFLASVFSAIDKDRPAATEVTAAELLDNGAARIESDLSDQPQVASRLMGTMADAYYALGKYERSLSLGEKALAFHEQLADGDPIERARLLKDLGMTYRRVNRVDEAQAHVQRAVAVLERANMADSLPGAASIRELAIMQARSGQFNEAISTQRRVLDIYRRLEAESTQANAEALIDLGTMLASAGDYEASEQSFQKGIALEIDILGPDHPGLASSYSSMATLYGRWERYEEAEEMVKRSIAISEPNLGAEHPRMGTDWLTLGQIQRLRGNAAAAIESLQRARVIYEAGYGAQDVRYGIVHVQLAEAHLLLGHTGEAKLAAQKAYDILGPEGPRMMRFFVGAVAALANAHHDEGSVKQAETLFLEALALLPVDQDATRAQIVDDYVELLRQSGRDEEADTLLAAEDR